jgi:hypothetical protein
MAQTSAVLPGEPCIVHPVPFGIGPGTGTNRGSGSSEPGTSMKPMTPPLTTNFPGGQENTPNSSAPMVTSLVTSSHPVPPPDTSETGPTCTSLFLHWERTNTDPLGFAHSTSASAGAGSPTMRINIEAIFSRSYPFPPLKNPAFNHSKIFYLLKEIVYQAKVTVRAILGWCRVLWDHYKLAQKRDKSSSRLSGFTLR